MLKYLLLCVCKDFQQKREQRHSHLQMVGTGEGVILKLDWMDTTPPLHCIQMNLLISMVRADVGEALSWP